MHYARKSDAEQFLLKLPRFAGIDDDSYKPGLERITQLFNAMDRPQESVPVVHIAGTNGKGSTASMLASILTSAGLKVGLHTSPHLRRVTERMRVNGNAAGDDWLTAAVERWGDLFTKTGASFYEAVLALSVAFFAEKAVDVAIVETGLGGRLDASNSLHPHVSVITRIGLDHQQILGNSIEEIAAEKAGIIKPGIPIVSGAGDEAAHRIIRAQAERQDAPIHVLDDEVLYGADAIGLVEFKTPSNTYGKINLELAGEHQTKNAALAIRACELLSIGPPDITEAVKTGLENVKALSGLRGRHEQIWFRPTIVVDVAHNAQAMSASFNTMKQRMGSVDKVFIGLMQDKDVSEFAALLKRENVPVSTILIYDERAFDPESFGSILEALGLTVEEPSMDLFITLDELVQESDPDSNILILGSHTVAAEALGWADQFTS